jgi:hypothetical protein
MKIRNLFIIIFLLICFSYLNAQVPQLINYQGMLRDNDGQPVNTEVDIEFSIYESETATESLWQEDHTITPQNGVFNVLLGSAKGFPTGLFADHDELYLAIQVGTDTEMKTRFRLGSVAFALHSAQSDTAKVALKALTTSEKIWEINGNDVYNNNSGNIGIGINNPLQKLHVNGVVQVNGFKMSTGASNNYVLTSDESGNGTWKQISQGLTGNGSANYISRFTSASNLGNSIIFQSGSNIGIGTTTPNAKLDVRGSISTGLKGSGGSLNLAATSSSEEGGQIDWEGASTYDSWVQDVYRNQMRFFSNSANTNMVRFENIGTGITNLYLEGSVGIGTASLNEKLDVNGSIQVSGEFKYSNNKTRYYAVHPSDFHPMNGSVFALHGGQDYGIFGDSNGKAFAPVKLPQDAIITEIRIYYTDQSTENLTLTLHRVPYSGLGSTDHGSVSSSENDGGTPIARQKYFNPNLQVDNSSYRYLVIYESPLANNLHRLYSVRIQYTINKAE